MPGTRPRLLVVHADPSVRRWAVSALAGLGEVVNAATLDEAASRLPLPAVDVMLADPALAVPYPSALESVPWIALLAGPPAGAPAEFPEPGFLWTLKPPATVGECERAR